MGGLAERIRDVDVRIDTETHDPACPVRELLDRIGDKWSVMIILNLGEHDVLRFGALKRAVPGISTRMLAKSLGDLQRDGLVERTVRQTRPLAVDYRLTALGDTLLQPIATLAKWAFDHREDVILARAAFAAQG